jgi:hypothetical protein
MLPVNPGHARDIYKCHYYYIKSHLIN